MTNVELQGKTEVRWERPFDDHGNVEPAAGVDLHEGAWNATVIRQEDGVVVLEAPISSVYTGGSPSFAAPIDDMRHPYWIV